MFQFPRPYQCSFLYLTRESGAVQFEVHLRRVRSATKNSSGFGDKFLTSSENASTYGVPLVWEKLPDYHDVGSPLYLKTVDPTGTRRRAGEVSDVVVAFGVGMY